jgi:hypothetical protein
MLRRSGRAQASPIAALDTSVVVGALESPGVVDARVGYSSANLPPVI